jgi:CheY-like chemotaxis protein
VLQLRSVDLNEVVRDAEKLLRRVIGADIEIVTRRTPDLPRITADPSQVSQILLNLAVNARDAMPVSGILTIETAVAYLDESYSQAHQALVTPGRYVMVAVTDNGSGMDADTQAHLFEPFFTTKAPGRGAGLGLATVYGIVKQSGGFIWVYSEIGRGTTFKVYFPAEGHLDAPKVPAEPDSAVAHGTETVLLVEDATSVRELARQALERHGYRVIAAADGRQALDLAEAERGRIDLLLTDLVMPGMGGREVADRLKALMPEIRVLYTSGYTDDTVVRHRLLTDGLAYLQKPFLPSQLARKVRAVLDGALGEP